MRDAHKHLLVAVLIAVAGAVVAKREADEEAQLIVWTQVAILLGTWMYCTGLGWEALSSPDGGGTAEKRPEANDSS